MEEEDDDLVELDDDWGYVDPEVISENVPEITDELKGIRKIDLNLGQTLSDSIGLNDELIITLKGCGKNPVELKLYASNNTAIRTMLDGKAVNFTPADSDIPNMKLELKVSDEELAARKAKWQPREPRVTTGYLARYASMVTSGNRGAILEISK